MQPAIFFLVATEQQLQNARSVAMRLPPSFVIDPYASLAKPLDDRINVTRPVKFRVTPRAIVRARLVVKRAFSLAPVSSRVLVIGQDVGYVERAAVAAACAAGARLILMPDGIVASKRLGGAESQSIGTAARDAVDGLLRSARLLAGRRDDFGASEPHVVLSWGPGWEDTWRTRCPGAKIVNTGSPRADDYLTMTPRSGVGNVLVCSQPLLLPQHGTVRQQAEIWYGWLAKLCETAHPRLRLRLHPAERQDRYPLPCELMSLRSSPGAPLLDDLRWADVVVAPFSSVLVEAMAARRVPIAAGGTKVWGAFADNAFLADQRVPSIDFRSSPTPSRLIECAAEAAARTDDLRDEFLANLGMAAAAAAQAILGHGVA